MSVLAREPEGSAAGDDPRGPLRAPCPAPVELSAAVTLSLARSRQLIDECRQGLRSQHAQLAVLRASLAPPRPAPGATVTPRPAAPRDVLAGEVALGGLTLVPVHHTVRGAGTEVRLTPTEWQLLVALARARPRVISRPGLAGAAWGPRFAGRRGEVEVYVSRLRRKLARVGPGIGIETVRGEGYRLVVDATV